MDEPERPKARRARSDWGWLYERGGKWYLAYRDEHGTRRHRLAGLTEYAAKRFRTAKQREVSAARRGVVARPMTLFTWWDTEYAEIVASRVKSVTVARSHLQRLLVWLHAERGDPYLRDITRADAEAFIAHLVVGERLAPSYVRRLVATLRRAWKDAVVRELAGSNIWERISLPTVPETEVPWVTPAQLEALYAACADSIRDHVTVLGETGLRIGELGALARGDVDLERDLVTVRSGKSRAARRSIPLTPTARRVLAARAETAVGRDALLLPLCVQWVRTGLTNACKRAGLPRLTPHKLRHVTASHLVQAGIPPTTVASILGHADGGALVLRLYGRWMPRDAQQRAMAALTGWREARVADAAPAESARGSPPPPPSAP